MLRFTNCGLALLFVSAVACQKSAPEERNEAINAQREADQTAREAAGERNKEVAQANKEAAKDINQAQREAHEDSLKAVKNEIEKTSGAQATANEEAKEAVDATNKGRVDLKKSADSRLKKIDERSHDLHKKIDGMTATKVPADVRTSLADADRQTAGVRTEVQQLDTAKAQPVSDLRVKIERSLDGIEKSLDRIDDKL